MTARGLLSLGALLALSPTSGQAARQAAISAESLLQRSGAVVQVRITEVDPFAGHGWPATRVRYVIERRIGGGPPGEVGDFLLPEGIESDGMTWSGYAGVPEFSPGEAYLLFLRHAPWYISPITHWRAGHLRQVDVAGRTLYVGGDGACVVDWGETLRFGPRVVDPPPSPGRGAVWSPTPPTPSAAAACLPAHRLRTRLRRQMHRLGWRPRPVPATPIDGRPVFETAEVP